MMKRVFSNFAKNTSGNFSMWLAVVSIPLIGSVGLVLDYTNARRMQVEIENALDAAALAAAKEAPSKRQNVAEDVFASNLEFSSFNITAKPVITNVGTALSATLSADYEPLFPFLLETKVSALSEVDMGNSGKTEIVFVLDYSSSMNSKYAVMRDAVVSVINQVTNNQTNPDTKIGLVPFARQVYATMDGKYVLGGTTGVPWTNCTIDRKYPWVWKDQTPTGATDSKWGRTDSNDTIESDEYDDCPNYPSRNLVVRPLSNAHADTVAQMLAMTPYSGTNIALGMEFGYQVISPEAPWTEGAEYDDSDVRKYIVLLSDGRHNKKGFGPGNQFSVERGRWNLQKVCSELKKNSVEVITIAYDLDDSEGKDELKSCATSSSRYYFEGDESNIMEIFGDVGRLVSNMRLTK